MMFSDRLREAIEEKRRRLAPIEYTHADVAAAVGRHRSTITRLQNGGVVKNLEFMAALARELEVSVDWLAGLTPDMTPARDLARQIDNLRKGIGELHASMAERSENSTDSPDSAISGQ